MAQSLAQIESAVTAIGWGKYQNYVTLACGCVQST